MNEAKPVGRWEGLSEVAGALDPGRGPQVLAGELEQIEHNKVKLTGGRRVGLKRGAAHRGEVLDGMPVTGTQRDELGVEHRAAWCVARAARSSGPRRSPRLAPRRDQARVRPC